ncbi:MAG: GGDEF domain-containing protein [Planctomycetes bacterium]|nr:GGDEF domain-containing protein [Planctomycetota bacterium]NOG53663.1 GGDEF domain-containing protein [Planctomycetota bacterium]
MGTAVSDDLINEHIASGDFFKQIINGLDDGVYIVDPERRITFWSHGAHRITGYTPDEVLGQSCADGILVHVDEGGNYLCKEGCPLAATMQDCQHRSCNVFLHHKDGHRVPVRVSASVIQDRFGRTIGCVESFQDQSGTQADVERIKELEEMAFFDALTGIVNRRYVESTFASRFAEMDRLDRPFSVIMLDVDHFKKFNDTYGHETGDRVLQLVARTLSCNCRPYDTVGRWGGEEFMIVATGTDQETITGLAERLRMLVETSSLDVDGENLHVTISLGVTPVRPGDDMKSLTNRVDDLLYQSKEQGRNRVTYCA